MPIPDPTSTVRYGDIYSGIHGCETLGSIADALPGCLISSSDRAHLDPDLDRSAIARLPGWRATFGQDAQAQSHLTNRGIEVGDLFLMFGWFRRVSPSRGGKLRYIAQAPNLHVFFGWLQIGRIVRLGEGDDHPPWAAGHPHLFGKRTEKNTLYISSDTLSLPGATISARGAGVFPFYHETLRLTGNGENLRSRWHLPSWFFRKSTSRLSYHEDEDRWTKCDGYVVLNSSPRGQEFVLNGDAYPEAVGWAAQIIDAAKAAEKAALR